jgi:hypothetical protein
VGPRADQRAAQAEVDSAEPDDMYVGRLRGQFETHMRVSAISASGYRYPALVTGPSAADYPPPQPGAPEPDHGIEPGA